MQRLGTFAQPRSVIRDQDFGSYLRTGICGTAAPGFHPGYKKSTVGPVPVALSTERNVEANISVPDTPTIGWRLTVVR